ncbi:glycosyltransferase family 39 protein [Chitinophaga horti]|uniref:Glycosyltransferase family 39 protein n=1 Tax=Chitinophaga horti TaxID=2920382 RepID=A0ABY6J2B3_9BACT|nr:glycosyltransferase family 39 protein [Chitinophaga horti]UYQ92501.1 glycosyltransferase family 39 protein [Chitinophaga horti]
MSTFLSYIRRDKYKSIFYFVWFALGVAQALFTGLMDDEAYYWVYSRNLSWGYFDHPPMIALLIKLGYAVFHNELGVRIGMVVLNVLTLMLVDDMLRPKNNRVFYLIMGAMGAMQLGGMLAVPDVPLIFFATLYFRIYKDFLEKQDWQNTILLGLSMALMFYSKYHGVLLVFFTVLSNVSLLKVTRYYIACIITTVLFLPHIYWQYTHHFPSLQYHLVERNADAYQLNYSIEYIIGQLLLFGPLMGWLLLYYAFSSPVQRTFERTLKFCLTGVLVFFLISTFKGRVEANWTVMVFTPLVILAHQSIIRNKRSLKPLIYTLPISLALVLVTRVYMVWDFMPGVHVRPELHHNQEWANAIKAKAGDRPVVFFNSYQAPSKYMFYTGGEAYSFNTVSNRRSQYNYWHMEEPIWNKEVLLVGGYRPFFQQPDSLTDARGKIYLEKYAPYVSYSLLQFTQAESKVTTTPGADLHFRLGKQSDYTVALPFPADRPAVTGYAIMGKDKYFDTVRTTLTLREALTRDSIDVLVKAPQTPGSYRLKYTVFVPGLPPTHNSQTIKLIVE